MRTSGILLHISSLPSPYGIGTFGKTAYQFVDFLKKSGQTYWQILPLGPTGYGDSPYQTFSTFAGNPYFIDLDVLVEKGLLKKSEITSIDWGKNPERVDFGKIYNHRLNVLHKAYVRGWKKEAKKIRAFYQSNRSWLEPYALYTECKQIHAGKPWYKWPKEERLCYTTKDGAKVRKRILQENQEEIDFIVYVQYLFFQQWSALKAYAKKKGISFIGDVPIYVPLDSSDVWSEPKYFLLDSNLKPKKVAGVPPDGFTKDGQLWGNPLYDWKTMKKDGYAWWIRRLKAAAKLFDVVRIDHFRGLASYWAVPAKDKTAARGKWEKGPGKDFIRAIQTKCKSISFIAEDLGYHTKDVQDLLDFSGFPGMKVLEFAFDTREPSDYLPHNYPNHCVCYTGTHDNMTAKQWYQEINASDRKYAKDYMGLNAIEGPVYGMIRNGMGSDANHFICQMQDWLQLGKQARMNVPGTFAGQNWKWRMKGNALTSALSKKIAYMTTIYARTPREKESD